MANPDNSDLRALERSLRAAGEPPGATWARIRRDLAAGVEAEGLVDVVIERHDSPLGPILLGATHEGLVRVGLPAEGEDAVLAELGERVSLRLLASSRDSLTRARRQLEEYFDGQRREFDVPLDWQLTAGFRRAVLRATAQIPYGQTASYREVATEAGSPRAVRAAGSALATNPLAIVVPCHRVLRSGGGVGGYRGGPEAKAQLLSLERGP